LAPPSEALIPPTDAHIGGEPDGVRDSLDHPACAIDAGSRRCVDVELVVIAREHGPEGQQAPELAAEHQLARAQSLEHVTDAVRVTERRPQTPVLIELG